MSVSEQAFARTLHCLWPSVPLLPHLLRRLSVACSVVVRWPRWKRQIAKGEELGLVTNPRAIRRRNGQWLLPKSFVAAILIMRSAAVSARPAAALGHL